MINMLSIKLALIKWTDGLHYFIWTTDPAVLQAIVSCGFGLVK